MFGKRKEISVSREEGDRIAREVVRLFRADDAGDAPARSKVANLEREKVQLEIRLDRVKEEHARETREIEHMVGLHKEQVKQEMELAERSAKIAVREENLTADRERFEEHLSFMRERTETELERLGKLTGEILERLPTVTVDRRIADA